MTPTESDSLDLVRICCRALEEKKAGELRVLDVRELSSITNYLVIATATSEPHVRALRIELEKALDAAKARIVGIETARESGWTVMDAFDVMVHLFNSDTRTRFGLEKLWKDAPQVSMAAIPVPKARARRPAKGVKKAPSRRRRTS